MHIQLTLGILLQLSILIHFIETSRDLIGQTFTLLKGPVNQTVELGGMVHLQCRVYDRPMQKVEHFTTKHFVVQWIINGFGVTNETLKAVYGMRYHMPGPSDRGIYDLEITNVQLEDEASFLCQADVRVDSVQGQTLVETLTSQPVNLTVIVPPKHLELRVVDQNVAGDSERWGTRKSHERRYGFPAETSSALRVVADDPDLDTRRLHSHKRGNESNINYDSEDIRSLTYKSPTEIWIPVDERLIIECQSTQSKPASKLAWFISDSPLVQENVTGDSSNLFYTDHATEEFRITERQLSISEAQIISQNDNLGADDANMLITISILRLLVKRRHQDQRLQCRVENSVAFLSTVLPTVHATLQPICKWNHFGYKCFEYTV